MKSFQSPAQVEKIKTNPKTLARNQLPTLSISRELNLRTAARHEAFDTLRSSTFSRDFCLFGGFSSSVSQDTYDFTELSLNHAGSHSPPSSHSRSGGTSYGFSRGATDSGGSAGLPIPNNESVSQLTNASECYAYDAYRKKNTIVLSKNPVAAIKSHQKQQLPFQRQKSPQSPTKDKFSLSQPVSSQYQPQQYTYHQQTSYIFQQQQRPTTSFSTPNLHQTNYSGQNSPTTRGASGIGGDFRKGSAMEYSQSLGSLHGPSSVPFGHISSSIHMSHSNQS